MRKSALLALLFLWHRTIGQESAAQTDVSCLSGDVTETELSTCRFFTVVFDAGSSGTRIHIFEFSLRPDTNKVQPFVLISEQFQRITPGLSNYANEPAKAAQSLAALMERAKTEIEPRNWGDTPLALRATAGLRLLPGNQADQILQKVRELFQSEPFLTNNESVSLINGTSEGIYGWLSQNILLDRIDSAFSANRPIRLQMSSRTGTVATMDMGGGSTQITFRPLTQDSFSAAPTNYINPFNIFGTNIQLYSHSYLGMGLDAARLGILQANNRGETQTLTSSCLRPTDGQTFEWNYDRQNYTVTRPNGASSFKDCEQETSSFVLASNVHRPAELADREIHAFGYFYWRLMQAGLIVEQVDGTTPVTLNQLAKAAKNACDGELSMSIDDDLKEWFCLDLTYLYSLWKDGYGLPLHKTIYISRTINEVEASWALGAAFTLSNDVYEKSTAKNLMKRMDQNQNQSLMNIMERPARMVLQWLSRAIKYFNRPQ